MVRQERNLGLGPLHYRTCANSQKRIDSCGSKQNQQEQQIHGQQAC